MKRSKLEKYVDILHLLAEEGPLKLTDLMNSANISNHQIKQQMAFLVKQGMVNEKPIGKTRVTYLASESGLRVVKFFRGEKPVLPLLERIPE